MKEVYDYLKKMYQVEWYVPEIEFYVYFNTKHKKYRLLVTEELILINRYMFNHWVPIAHKRYAFNTSIKDKCVEIINELSK